MNKNNFEKNIFYNVIDDLLKIDRNKKLYDKYKNCSIKDLNYMINNFDSFYNDLDNNMIKFYLSNNINKSYFVLILIYIVNLKLNEI